MPENTWKVFMLSQSKALPKHVSIRERPCFLLVSVLKPMAGILNAKAFVQQLHKNQSNTGV